MIMSDFDLASIGFGLAAIGYLLFWALLLTVKARNTQRHLLAVYALMSVLWGIYYGMSSPMPFSVDASFLLETSLQTVTLLFFLSALSRADINAKQFFRNKKIVVVTGSMIIWTLANLLLALPFSTRLLGAILISVVSLSVLETLYRKSAEKRWQFKPLLLAFGINLLFDFYLFAEAVLLDRIVPQTWMARGWIHLVTLPLLVLSINRIKHWGINVYISRDIVLQSSLLLGAGLYLCLLAFAGYYIKFFGGSWSTLLQIIFLGVGATALIVVAFSDAIRRKVRVFIEKHFFANTFDYREKWVELTRQLNKVSLSEVNTSEICLGAICKAIGYSNGILVKCTRTDLQSLGQQGNIDFNRDAIELLHRYQQRFDNKNWLIDFNDHKDAEVTSLLQQPTAIAAPFALLIPIYKQQSHWGYFLLKPNPTESLRLNWELRDYLNAVTEQISSYLFMAEASQQLSENAQFVAFSRMSAFVVHDLKNVKAQIDMLLKNAKRHKHNPEFIDDAFTTIEAMQSRLQNMLSQLTNKQGATDQVRKVNLNQLVDRLIVERCHSFLPLPLKKSDAEVEIQIDAERLENVLFHLIDNAQQATEDDGLVFVRIGQDSFYATIAISDTGSGMSEDFIKHRLFKPFDTTKGNAGMGIGAYDALTFAEQSGGSLTVASEVGKGTTFTMRLPLRLTHS